MNPLLVFPGRRAFYSLAAYSLAGCAVLLPALAPPAASPSALWIDVPFVRQPRDGCGAASLWMVMEYWSRQPQAAARAAVPDVTTIQRRLYSSRDRGIPASSMAAFLRENGFQAFPLHGSWTDLVAQIGKGRPLIAALRPRSQAALHYVVIAGVDSAQQTVLMNDPAARKLLTEERADFENEWSATQNWLLLALPAPLP